jgi:pimeloyl-ACP methyl ester carboxylesterase
MVDVGGRKLHLQCDGSGSPTVILEAGLTGDHRMWDEVFTDVHSGFAEVQAAGPVPDRPLVVITVGRPEAWPPGWDPEVFDRLRDGQQKDLVGLTSHGTQLIAEDSGHDVPLSQPGLVVEGIERVLSEVGSAG